MAAQDSAVAPDRPAAIARWLVEAFESGNPLAPLPDGIAPRDAEEAEAAAVAVLDSLDLTPCGVRLRRSGEGAALSGPMLEGRLLRSPAPVSLAALRHPVVTAAVIGVLAEALDPDGDAPPVLARLHPALDIAATRFTIPRPTILR
jgi:hypothetical protein